MLPICRSLWAWFATLFSFIYSTFRVVYIMVQNLYCLTSYMFISNIALLPIYYFSVEIYATIENILYNWLLYIVSSWSWCAGLVVYEHGDDIYQLREDPKTRILVLSNHQSTADVPLIMQAFSARSKYSLLWIMDSMFKYTHFGLVSNTHGDYFIDAKKYKPMGIHKHAISRYANNKDAFLLFPEGGFRYKRQKSSNSFAQKKNLPQLSNVVYPRYAGFSELLENDVKITHVVDLTICYDSREHSPWIWDIMWGNGKASQIHFHYKIFPVATTPNIKTEAWLQRRWQAKEKILERHYRMVDNENGVSSTNGDVSFSAIDISACKSPERDNFENNNPQDSPSSEMSTPYDNDVDNSDAGLLLRRASGRRINLEWRRIIGVNIFFLTSFLLLVQVVVLCVQLSHYIH